MTLEKSPGTKTAKDKNNSWLWERNIQYTDEILEVSQIPAIRWRNEVRWYLCNQSMLKYNKQCLKTAKFAAN